MFDGTITARNYAAQAERGLRTAALQFGPTDGRVVRGMCERISRAVHFAMPDGGRLFDDHGRGIAGRELRLPFPLITVEYFSDGADSERGLVSMPKRLVIAEEMTRAEVHAYCAQHGSSGAACVEDRYVVVTWAATSSVGEWVPGACALAIPTAWDSTASHDDRTEHIKSLTGEAGATRMNAVPIMTIRSIAEGYLKHLKSVEVARQHLVHDAAVEAGVIIELCEALSCSNVGSEVAQPAPDPAKAARRARDGKLPIYETRVLTVQAGSSSGRSGGSADDGGSRVGPRQYLRRGHIRRLPSGKQIWVQSCVVGNELAGMIEKTYAVRR